MNELVLFLNKLNYASTKSCAEFSSILSFDNSHLQTMIWFHQFTLLCVVAILGVSECFFIRSSKLISKLFMTVDSDNVIARGTPFERPKIADSIVDLVGATPMVMQKSFVLYLQ